MSASPVRVGISLLTALAIALILAAAAPVVGVVRAAAAETVGTDWASKLLIADGAFTSSDGASVLIVSGTLDTMLGADDVLKLETDSAGTLLAGIVDTVLAAELLVVVTFETFPPAVVLLLSVPNLLSLLQRLSLSKLLTKAGLVSIPLIVLVKLVLPVVTGFESLSKG